MYILEQETLDPQLDDQPRCEVCGCVEKEYGSVCGPCVEAT